MPGETQDPCTASKQDNKGTFYQLKIIFGTAVILATLFTAWTPVMDTREQNTWEDISIAPVQTPIPVEQQITQPTRIPRSKPLIGIVAGHWGNDSGAVCNDGLTEVDVNINIATLVQKYLAEKGYDVDLLKEFDLQLTGYDATALVSIHADSCDFINDAATGFKVAQAMGSQYPERAARLTACLRSRYSQITGLPLHSTSVTEDMTSYHAFGEIYENTTAAIIETGFLNLDRQFLTGSPEISAQGIAAGIICFLENESISPSEAPTAPVNNPKP